MSTAMDHERANELLPWLANGSLEKSERTLVEQHVKSCLACRKSLREERKLRELMTRGADESLAVDEGFQRLLRRIDAAPQNSGQEPLGSVDGRKTSRKPRTWTASLSRWALAASVTLTLGTVVWLVRAELEGPLPDRYVTVTDAPAIDAARVDVIFLDGIGAEERAALFAEIGARVAAGPSPAGRYTLAFDSLDGREEAVAAVLARLRLDPRVRFAGRSFITEPPP